MLSVKRCRATEDTRYDQDLIHHLERHLQTRHAYVIHKILKWLNNGMRKILDSYVYGWSSFHKNYQNMNHNIRTVHWQTDKYKRS